jgi:cyclopropane fatty-acyl-phospholipid synthase-like methyltransferase
MAEETQADGDGLAEARCAAMRWNTPLSEAHAEILLDRLELPDSGSILDLGCGWGELLLRAVAATRDSPVTGMTGMTGIGVDTCVPDLERGRSAAAGRGLKDRVTFVKASAVSWDKPADRVLCIGATHAWGGSVGAITALSEMVKPDGMLLLGDGFWAREPSSAAIEIFGEEVSPLADLVRLAQFAGWDVRHLSQADQSEWDEFETSWRLGRHRWLAAHPDAPDAAKLREELEQSLLEYLDVYRGVLGYCYLVLTR